MKIKMSPLVAGLNGRAADAVAATWKGRAYVRKHIIPHNPKSAAQTLVRQSLLRCVALSRSLSANIHTWLNTYGVEYRMSGYNVFMKKNRALEQATSILKPVPENPLVQALNGFAYDSEPVAGSLKIKWTSTVVTGYTLVAVAIRDTLLNVFVQQSEATLQTALSYTFTGLTIGKTYQCYAFLKHTTLAKYGTSSGVSHTQLT